MSLTRTAAWMLLAGSALITPSVPSAPMKEEPAAVQMAELLPAPEDETAQAGPFRLEEGGDAKAQPPRMPERDAVSSWRDAEGAGEVKQRPAGEAVPAGIDQGSVVESR